MTEGKKNKTATRVDLSSGFQKTLLIVLAAVLTFGCPWLVYFAASILKIDYAISMVSGLVVFIIGLMLILYLIKKKVIS